LKVNTSRTDPNNPDTDGDGTDDYTDYYGTIDPDG